MVQFLLGRGKNEKDISVKPLMTLSRSGETRQEEGLPRPTAKTQYLNSLVSFPNIATASQLPKYFRLFSRCQGTTGAPDARESFLPCEIPQRDRGRRSEGAVRHRATIRSAASSVHCELLTEPHHKVQLPRPMTPSSSRLSYCFIRPTRCFPVTLPLTPEVQFRTVQYTNISCMGK